VIAGRLIYVLLNDYSLGGSRVTRRLIYAAGKATQHGLSLFCVMVPYSFTDAGLFFCVSFCFFNTDLSDWLRKPVHNGRFLSFGTLNL